MEEWKEYRLGDICTKIGSGATPKGGKEAYLGGNTSLIRSQNVLDFSFSWDGLAYIDDEQAAKLNGVIIESGDVLLNITGDSVARSCVVPESALPARVNQHVSIVRGEASIVLNDYILYFLQYKKPYLLSLSQGGATRNALTKGMIEDLLIPLPSLSKQAEIVRVLKSLDDKIELNKRINDNLEQQAQALFKSWFVDFEPFKNGEFVESELGMIPKGWRVYCLSEFLPVITGKKDANVAKGGPYPFFSCSQDFGWTDDYSFEGNAILVAGNGDFNVKTYNGKFEAYQRTYVLIPHNPQYTSWLFYAVKYHLNDITSAARGSVIKFITKGNLADFKFPAPQGLDKAEIIEKFDCFRRIIASNEQESRRLAELRDTLLPKLMSGELKVNEVEECI